MTTAYDNRGTLVNVKDPLPTPEQRNVVYHVPCADCPNAYVGQTGRQLSTRVKEPNGAVRRQDKNSLLALHCPAFDWDRASYRGSEKGPRNIRLILSRHGTLPSHVSVNA